MMRYDEIEFDNVDQLIEYKSKMNNKPMIIQKELPEKRIENKQAGKPLVHDWDAIIKDFMKRVASGQRTSKRDIMKENNISICGTSYEKFNQVLMKHMKTDLDLTKARKKNKKKSKSSNVRYTEQEDESLKKLFLLKSQGHINDLGSEIKALAKRMGRTKHALVTRAHSKGYYKILDI